MAQPRERRLLSRSANGSGNQQCRRLAIEAAIDPKRTSIARSADLNNGVSKIKKVNDENELEKSEGEPTLV